jgi:hypothetical protein
VKKERERERSIRNNASRLSTTTTTSFFFSHAAKRTSAFPERLRAAPVSRSARPSTARILLEEEEEEEAAAMVVNIYIYIYSESLLCERDISRLLGEESDMMRVQSVRLFVFFCFCFCDDDHAVIVVRLTMFRIFEIQNRSSLSIGLPEVFYLCSQKSAEMFKNNIFSKQKSGLY